MKQEILRYNELIRCLRRVQTCLNSAVNNINLFNIAIVNGISVNDGISFDKDFDNLRDKLINVKDNIANNIIPTLQNEKIAVTTRLK